MEKNIYTFSNRNLFSIKLSDDSVKEISKISEDYTISEVYLINEPGTLIIKENIYFQDSEDVELKKGDLLFIVKDYSLPTKSKYSCKYRAVVVNSGELANLILSNRNIEEERKKEKEEKSCCDECSGPCVGCNNF